MKIPNYVVFTREVNTSGRIYEDFLRLIFFHTNRESSCFSGELVEVSDQFRFLRADCLTNLEDSIGFILAKNNNPFGGSTYIDLQSCSAQKTLARTL
jgi:hypothetical protein